MCLKKLRLMTERGGHRQLKKQTVSRVVHVRGENTEHRTPRTESVLISDSRVCEASVTSEPLDHHGWQWQKRVKNEWGLHSDAAPDPHKPAPQGVRARVKGTAGRRKHQRPWGEGGEILLRRPSLTIDRLSGLLGSGWLGKGRLKHPVRDLVLRSFCFVGKVLGCGQ